MKTDDRRVRKTKKALQEGLAELMLEKDLRNITVRELADKVDIHRATFYAHYKDIYDLYEQMETSVIGDLGVIITGDPTHTYDDIFKTIIDYISDNTKACRMLLDINGNRSFHNQLSNFLVDKYLEIYQYENGQKDITEEWKFYVRYHIEGCLSVVGRWAETNYAFPKDALTEIIKTIDTKFDEFIY